MLEPVDESGEVISGRVQRHPPGHFGGKIPDLDKR